MSKISPVKKYLIHGLSAGIVISSAALFTGCASNANSGFGETYSQGYILDQQALDSVSVGSSKEQVDLALGSPSITATFDDEIYYYISQTSHRSARFMKATVVDRKILAIYFNKNGTVKKIANYSLKDGKVFDSISRTTPTGGVDQAFLGQLITGLKTVPSGIPTNPR